MSTARRAGSRPVALLAGAVLVSYWPALQGDFVWDDDVHVTAPARHRTPGAASTLRYEVATVGDRGYRS